MLNVDTCGKHSKRKLYFWRSEMKRAALYSTWHNFDEHTEPARKWIKGWSLLSSKMKRPKLRISCRIDILAIMMLLTCAKISFEQEKIWLYALHNNDRSLNETTHRIQWMVSVDFKYKTTSITKEIKISIHAGYLFSCSLFNLPWSSMFRWTSGCETSRWSVE